MGQYGKYAKLQRIGTWYVAHQILVHYVILRVSLQSCKAVCKHIFHEGYVITPFVRRIFVSSIILILPKAPRKIVVTLTCSVQKNIPSSAKFLLNILRSKCDGSLD